MAINDLSPGFIKLYYAVGTVTHVMTLPVKPVAPNPLVIGNIIDTYNGFGIAFATGMTTFITAIKPLFGATANFAYAELWSKPLPTDNPIFIEVATLSIAGTAGGANTVDLQGVITHRTQAGGIHRLYLMEFSSNPNQRDIAPFAAGNIKSISDFMVSGNSFIFGRDNARLTAPKAYTTKTNDALRKKRLNL